MQIMEDHYTSIIFSEGPEARFSKAPETLRLRCCQFHSHAYSLNEQISSSYKKFHAYTLLRFEIQMN